MKTLPSIKQLLLSNRRRSIHKNLTIQQKLILTIIKNQTQSRHENLTVHKKLIIRQLLNNRT